MRKNKYIELDRLGIELSESKGISVGVYDTKDKTFVGKFKITAKQLITLGRIFEAYGNGK